MSDSSSEVAVPKRKRRVFHKLFSSRNRLSLVLRGGQKYHESAVPASSIPTQTLPITDALGEARKSSKPQYEYRPLDKNTQEIRLVRILPGLSDDPLRIQIVHVPFDVPKPAPSTRQSLHKIGRTLTGDWEVYETLEGRYIFTNMEEGTTSWTHPDPSVKTELYDSPAVLDPYPDFEPAFEALSYKWGEETATKEVGVLENPDSRGMFSKRNRGEPKISSFFVRSNLFEALRHLRRPDEVRAMWIDAISINQGDMVERNKQVQRMAKIFKVARRVIVWLGTCAPDDPSEKALEILQYFGKQVEITIDDTHMGSPTKTEPDWYLFTKRLPFTDEEYIAIRAFLQRPWFNRLWVWQEIQLANHRAIMQLGRASAPWYHIRRAVLSLSEKQHQSNLIPRKLLDQRSSLGLNLTGGSLLWALEFTERANCLLVHDRIFALLGLCRRSNSRLIRVDYSIPIVDLFKNVCEAHLEVYDDLDFLRHCDGPENAISSSYTWIRNWHQPVPTDTMLVQNSAGQSGSCGARIVDSRLEVKGIECETIQSVSSPAAVSADLGSIFRQWRNDDLENGTYFTGDSMLDAFIQTVSLGQNKEKWQSRNYPKLSEWKEFYHSATTSDDLEASRRLHQIQNRVRDFVGGRSFFRAGKYMGIGPSSSRSGDVVAVLLGFDLCIILRPQPDSTYQLIGPAYVHGLSSCYALLGPLPQDWTVSYEYDGTGVLSLFHNEDTGEYSFQDPRLGELPEGWEYEEGYGLTATQKEWFWRSKSGASTSKDPRLTPEQLEKRGVHIRTFQLV